MLTWWVVINEGNKQERQDRNWALPSVKRQIDRGLFLKSPSLQKSQCLEVHPSKVFREAGGWGERRLDPALVKGENLSPL